MRVGGIKIGALCALGVLAFGVPVYADSGICNRFLAFAARVRGDATGEFKRRIAFLLETGKIGDEHLARMLASDVAVGPFESGVHLTSDIVPHADGISRLIGNVSLDWKKIRKYLEELRGKVEDGRKDAAVYEDKTKKVLYPYVVSEKTLNSNTSAFSRVFVKGDVRYLAQSVYGVPNYVELIDAHTNGRVRKININSWTSDSPELLEVKGKLYVVVSADKLDELYVANALTGRKVRVIKREPVISAHVTLEKDGVAYVVVGSHYGKQGDRSSYSKNSISVVELLTGRDVRTIGFDDWVNNLSVFKNNGASYILAQVGKREVYVIEASTWTVIQKFKIKETVLNKVVSFEEGGTSYVVMVDDVRGEIRVVEALTAKVVQTVVLKRNLFVGPVLFEANGSHYVVVGSEKDRFSTDGRLSVIEALTGKIVQDVKVAGVDIPNSEVFVRDGVSYVIIAASGGRIVIVDALGGKIVNSVKVEGAAVALSPVFEKDGCLYMMVQSEGEKRYVIQLYGPLPETKK